IPIAAAGNGKPPVGADARRDRNVVVFLVGHQLLSRRHIEHVAIAIAAQITDARQQLFAIWTECERVNLCALIGQHPQEIPRRSVPQPDLAVVATRGDRSIHWIYRDGTQLFLVASEHCDQSAVGYPPKSERSIKAACDCPLSIGSECAPIDFCRMSLEP